MTIARYNISVALSKEDNDRLEAVKVHGVKVVDIFKAGLEEMEKQTAHLEEKEG